MKCFLYSLIFLLFTVVLFQQSFSQSSLSAGMSGAKSFPTPDVAKISEHGLYPASPFNGTVQIGIPLHTVSYKELVIPISINYSTGGNQVEERSGVVGLGWSIMTGGSIYRKVNGLYDEHGNNNPAGGHAFNLGYYYNAGAFTTDLKDTSEVKKYVADLTNQVTTPYQLKESSPDEFIFNVNGMSGVFFFYQENASAPVSIKIRTNGDYTFKAEIVAIENNITFYDYRNINNNVAYFRQSEKAIRQIKLTDDKGVQYLFGGDSSSIDFSNSSSGINDDYYNIPTTWHLTEMISPYGYKIQLEYEKKGRTITHKRQRIGDAYHTVHDLTGVYFNNHFFKYNEFNINTYNEMVVTSDTYILNFPSHIKRIIAPNQTVDFNFSRTNDLLYDLGYGDNSFSKSFNIINNLIESASQSYWQKLNSIVVNDSFKIFNFYYRDTSNARLRLDSVSFKGEKASTVGEVYKFKYNNTQLPPYASRKKDHWGYYNDVEYIYDANYFSMRSPDAEKMKAEVLEEVIYPTGGFLKLEYEPHQYKKVAQQYPFVVRDTADNQMAGGLRIKKMTALADIQSTPVVKEYFYTTNYLNGGLASSGVLSGVPSYTKSGKGRSVFSFDRSWLDIYFTVEYYFMKGFDNNLYPLFSTNGSNVTYSEVVEKVGDSSYIKYIYSNLDNGYMDKEPYMVYGNYDAPYYDQGFVSLELFRGLNLKTEYFNSGKQLLRSTEYDYFIDTSSIYKVPYLHKNYISVGSLVILSRISSLAFFTKPALLKKTTEKEYIPVSGVQLESKVENIYLLQKYPSMNYLLDNYKPVEVLSMNAVGDTIKTTVEYPYHLETTFPYSLMVSRNIVSPVIRSIDSNITGRKEISRAKVEYYSFFNDAFVAPKIFSKSNGGDTLSVELTIDAYDYMGNILQQTDRSSVPNTFLWGYQGEYPIANIMGASWEVTKNHIDTSSFYKMSRHQINHQISNLRAAFQSNLLVNATTFDFKPLVGMIKSTDSRGLNTFYEYDDLHRLARIKDNDGNIIKKYYYNLASQPDENLANSIVFYNAYQEQSFRKNNCTSGGIGDDKVYKVPYGMFSSLVSQHQADSLAMKYLTDMNGQNDINTVGGCTWYNIEEVRTYYKQCGLNSDSGSAVIYTVPANKYSSRVSYTAARNLAIAEINANGQAYANANGICIYNCSVNSCDEGLMKRCVNGSCETGIQTMINCEYDFMMGRYVVWYVYMFSDLHPSRAWFEYSDEPCDW
ncbi:DUF5977 domain-containing protein [Gynurincola endophyticus]|uniref:DUF5977 domain-containing protein n=1 Tax=Gynurincola endophyticus TaxID=2479004 RepID=UPI000F8DA138|nr:DUF5977 domain-containing protein [Gynurincola endophyticus]